MEVSPRRFIQKGIWSITITLTVVVMSLFSCKDRNENLVPLSYDPETIPTMTTVHASQLISDSGITRYKLVADLWLVFDKAKEPYYYFPEGIYLEQFTPGYEIEATIQADTAWFYESKDLWRLKKRVHVENRKGEQFDSEELFWDRKKHRVYSDDYIEIRSGLTVLKGYGFESNEEMTNYQIFRPHDGKLPFVESNPVDSLMVDDEVETEENIGQSN